MKDGSLVGAFVGTGVGRLVGVLVGEGVGLEDRCCIRFASKL